MSHNLSNEVLAIINAWEKRYPGKFTEHEGNVNLILGYIQNKFGGVVSIENLNAAAKACHAALVFEKGHEAPDPRADQKVQAEADRKRNLRLRAGFNVNQSKIKTELDDADDARPASQAEILAAAKQDLEMKECLDEVNRSIERHQANTRGGRFDYARSERERGLLREELKRLIDRKAKPDAIRARIAELQTGFDNPSVR